MVGESVQKLAQGHCRVSRIIRKHPQDRKHHFGDLLGSVAARDRCKPAHLIPLSASPPASHFDILVPHMYPCMLRTYYFRPTPAASGHNADDNDGHSWPQSLRATSRHRGGDGPSRPRRPDCKGTTRTLIHYLSSKTLIGMTLHAFQTVVSSFEGKFLCGSRPVMKDAPPRRTRGLQDNPVHH